MTQSLLISITVITLIVLSSPAEGKRITLIPLSANDVYRILREAGREDAVPEGRVVSQGIAAISGFTLGLAKGVGGSLLFDIAANLLRVQNQAIQTQEVCFNSRSLNEIDDEDYDDDDAPQGRQAGTGGTATATPTGTGTGTATLTNAPSTTGTNTNLGTGTNTASGTTTLTGTGGAINCVVIQQPPVVAAGAAAVAAPVAAGVAAPVAAGVAAPVAAPAAVFG